MRKEAEEVGYQAMQVVAEQQVAHVPATELPEATQGIEAPMEADQETKGTASGAKRKAEEDPSEESKKARVGEYHLASDLQLFRSSRTTPDAQAVRSDLQLP